MPRVSDTEQRRWDGSNDGKESLAGRTSSSSGVSTRRTSTRRACWTRGQKSSEATPTPRTQPPLIARLFSIALLPSFLSRLALAVSLVRSLKLSPSHSCSLALARAPLFLSHTLSLTSALTALARALVPRNPSARSLPHSHARSLSPPLHPHRPCSHRSASFDLNAADSLSSPPRLWLLRWPGWSPTL